MFGGRRGDYILSQYDIHLSVFGIVFILPPRSIGDASIELLGDLNLRTFCSRFLSRAGENTSWARGGDNAGGHGGRERGGYCDSDGYVAAGNGARRGQDHGTTVAHHVDNFSLRRQRRADLEDRQF